MLTSCNNKRERDRIHWKWSYRMDRCSVMAGTTCNQFLSVGIYIFRWFSIWPYLLTWSFQYLTWFSMKRSDNRTTRRLQPSLQSTGQPKITVVVSALWFRTSSVWPYLDRQEKLPLSLSLTYHFIFYILYLKKNSPAVAESIGGIFSGPISRLFSSRSREID